MNLIDWISFSCIAIVVYQMVRSKDRKKEPLVIVMDGLISLYKLIVSPDKKKEPLVIVVDGLIAAGKSTFVKILENALRKKGYQVASVLEPVDLWIRLGILKEFYENPKQNAYKFQNSTFVTRIKYINDCLAQNPNLDIIILERTPLTDKYVFMELQKNIVKSEELELYNLWFPMLYDILRVDLKKAKYILLKTGLTKCMERMAKRARVEEVVLQTLPLEGVKEEKEEKKSGVSKEYQEKLEHAHDRLFLGKTSTTFPILLEERPFPLENVTLVEGELVDDDFSKPGKAQEDLLEFLYKKLGI